MIALAGIAFAFFIGSLTGSRGVKDAKDMRDEYKRRLNRVLEQETSGANATVIRIMKLARGELI
ncbi:MAG: hypothetical protein DI547_04870 [Sphingobium sp.]|nr:MAG: hypothetical protein DI547_04870 [Sphingobium sp.]